MSKAKETSGAHGLSPSQWSEKLEGALESRDQTDLKELLMDLTLEIRDEADSISRFDRGPVLDRLVEHARRFALSDPTQMEALAKELDDERKLCEEAKENCPVEAIGDDG